MLEVLAILTLLAVGAIVFGMIALLAGLIKFTFKLALLPIVPGLKALVFVIGFVIALVVVGPVVLVLGLVLLIPLLILGGLVWAGIAVVT
ncbi:MAG: hypothetical protein OEV48_15280 [Acidobacteriota bacterium]|nr:hypothetical protein [Acidobacteriota bacterium]